MWARAAADAVVVAHLAFVGFMVLGGFAVWRWPRLLPVHLGALAVSLVIFGTGSECPLTNVQNALERAGGEVPSQQGFIDRYLVRPIHPAGITPAIRWGIPVVVLALQVAAYGGLWLRRHHTSGRRLTARPA